MLRILPTHCHSFLGDLLSTDTNSKQPLHKGIALAVSPCTTYVRGGAFDSLEQDRLKSGSMILDYEINGTSWQTMDFNYGLL